MQDTKRQILILFIVWLFALLLFFVSCYFISVKCHSIGYLLFDYKKLSCTTENIILHPIRLFVEVLPYAGFIMIPIIICLIAFLGQSKTKSNLFINALLACGVIIILFLLLMIYPEVKKLFYYSLPKKLPFQ